MTDNKFMEKIDMQLFKENRGFITLTFILYIIICSGTLLKPSYVDNLFIAMFVSITGLFVMAWWFSAFWNKILTKIFNFRPLSFGVALLLSAAIMLLIA
jgi:hypothetical protein